MPKIKPEVRATVYPHNWGFLVPCESGVVWEQQTCGVLCHHVYVEGVFIPLRKPGDLLDELAEANYHGESTKNLWSKIKEEVHFDFEVVDAPPGYPTNQEGFLWIKLTKFEPGWGHGPWVKTLLGKVMMLIYPNSD